MGTFKALLQNKLQDIDTQDQSINSAFFNQNSDGYTMMSVDMTAFYGIFDNAQTAIANRYVEITTAGNTFTSQIVGTSSSSIPK